MQFFKVMMPGFHQKLGLPISVCEEIKRQKSQRVTLESRLGTWKISMCRSREEDDDYSLYLNKGWSEFVDVHALSIGDFLVFQHTTYLHFNVTVFDNTACEKEYLQVEEKKDEAAAAQTQTVNRRSNRSSSEEKSRCFVKKMMPSHAKMDAKVYMTANFVRENSLERHTSVALRDSRGRQWPVKLTTKGRMGRGWNDFYVSNALKDGDTCVFQLINPHLQTLTTSTSTSTTIVFDVKIVSSATL